MLVVGEDAGGRTVTATPQQVAAVSRDLEITIDEVERLAKQTLTELRDRAERNRDRLSSDGLQRAHFGRSPAAAELAETYRGAHDVFVATVEAVLADLESFRGRLLDALRTYRDRDQAGEELLLRTSRMAEGMRYTAERVKAAAYAEHAHLLGAGGVDGAESPPGGGHDGPPVTAAPPPRTGGGAFDGSVG